MKYYLANHSLAISWPTTNQLLIFKIAKSDAKGKGTSTNIRLRLID